MMPRDRTAALPGPKQRPVVPGAIAAFLVVNLVAAVAAGAPVFVVNSIDDSSSDRCDARHCTLREAILAANAEGGAEIRFDLPSWPYVYELQSALPALEDHVFVDGASQEGAECPLPVVQLDGSRIAPGERVNGLEILGDDNRVRGIIVTNFGGHGVVVYGSRNVVQCSFVGVGPTGTEPEGNGGHGVAVVGGHSNQIGGPDFRDVNLLSDNAGYGLYIEDALDTHRRNNGVGIDIFGNPKLPNGDAALDALNPPPPPSSLSERALVQIRRVIRRRLATIIEENASALEESGLYEVYVRLLGEDPAGRTPADLAELIAALVLQPELYAAFTADASAVVSDARAVTAAATVDLYLSFKDAIPAFGRDARKLPEDQRDLLSEDLAACSPDACVTSAGPSDLVAVETDPDIGLSPLRWHSLTTYGPTSFNAELGNLPIITTCQGIATPCFWPIAYDLLPFSATLKWETDFTQQELEDIVGEDGYFLRLKVNGQLLVSGPKFGVDPAQGYYAATYPDDPGCPAGKRCLSTSVRVRSILWNVPKPWVFELEVLKLSPLPTPIIIGIDEFGNPVFATHESKRFVYATRTIQSNQATGNQKWFTAALFPTFQHDRCTHCHSLDDAFALATHHGFTSTAAFVSTTNLHLEPSAFVPGAHVNACTNCHALSLTDGNGHPFHEVEWLTPYTDLQVNWSQMNATQICARVKVNLPTDQLRHEHFHGDARLFWAIEDPFVPVTTLPGAPPQDFGEFLRRVDLWNYFGAPCP